MSASQDIPKAPRRKRRSFELDSPRWWLTTGIWMILIPLALFWLSRPKTSRPSESSRDIRQGIINARLVFMALSEFEKKYGRYPDEETAVRVREEAGAFPGSAGHSSNSIFRQLFAAGITEDEKIFHAKISGGRVPDGVISGERLLEKGECAFSYLAGATACDPPE
ncbi:MAG: hypothetical protein EOP85_17380, partial [Verrucomicrobiaceae bacterium]